MTYANLSLVLGGAASGKSVFAEALVGASGRRLVYVATAAAGDAEMAEKIALHRARRGDDWRTVEAPLDVGAALAGMRAGEAALVDCATLWLTNHVLRDSDLDAATSGLLEALEGANGPVVVVSNEVGLGVVPDTPLGRRFREAQGALNQRLAQSAGLVVMVVAGLPMVLKGRLPEGVP